MLELKKYHREYLHVLLKMPYKSCLVSTIIFITRGCGGTGAIVSIHNGLYASVVDKYGTSQQKTKFLPSFVDGSSVGSFALSEPGLFSELVK